MEAVNFADWFLVAFTMVIAGSTIAYTVVTSRLLKQSRNAFLTDTVIRVMQRVGDIHRRTRGLSTGGSAMRRYEADAVATVKSVDEKLGQEFEKALRKAIPL